MRMIFILKYLMIITTIIKIIIKRNQNKKQLLREIPKKSVEYKHEKNPNSNGAHQLIFMGLMKMLQRKQKFIVALIFALYLLLVINISNRI